MRSCNLFVLLLWGAVLGTPVLRADAQAAGRAGTSLDGARRDLNHGYADRALSQLAAALAADAKNAEAYNLRCRVYYAEQQWDKAMDDCQRAAQLEPGNSDYHLWLARALGEKADHSSFVAAFRLAKQVRTEFEVAAQLNPKSPAALADLGEFYADAPAVIGGGTDKAARVADALAALDASRAHSLRAQIASARKDPAKAEAELKAAVAAAQYPAEAWVELGSFYRRQGRLDEMVAAVKKAAESPREKDTALADGASLLVRAQREPQMALALYRRYLASERKSEDAPAFVVKTMLAALLESAGNVEAASRERAEAHAMATGYAAAGEGLQSGISGR